MTDDIKDLLGRAIGAEPPLRLDRDEVLRAGRKRLRRRRALEAGGVVAAVVVAAVGASMLTGVIGAAPDGDRLPPAATTTTDNGPIPGIDLPLTTGPSAPAGPPLSTQHADLLTDRLFASPVIAATGALMATEGGDDQLAFRVESGAYVFEADVVTSTEDSAFQVSVEAASPDERTSCDLVPELYDNCKVYEKGPDSEVAIANWKSVDGEKRILVLSVHDGSKVVAVSTNISSQKRTKGKQADGRDPILDSTELTMLVLDTDLRAY